MDFHSIHPLLLRHGLLSGIIIGAAGQFVDLPVLLLTLKFMHFRKRRRRRRREGRGEEGPCGYNNTLPCNRCTSSSRPK
jgi:hypothetical protein